MEVASQDRVAPGVIGTDGQAGPVVVVEVDWPPEELRGPHDTAQRQTLDDRGRVRREGPEAEGADATLESVVLLAVESWSRLVTSFV
jgi:hypothetical protein